MSLADNGRGYEMGLLDWLERRRTRKRFAEHISPEVIKLIEQDPSTYFNHGPEEQHFQWVLINLGGVPLREIPALTANIVESCFRHHSVVSGIMFALVLAHFGKLGSADKVEERRALVSDLLAENGGRIRIAHGQCTGLVGNIGGEHRLSWEAIVPGFNGILETLVNSRFGTAIEVSEAPARTPAAAPD